MPAKAVARLREKAEDRLRQEAARQGFSRGFGRLRKDDWTLRRLLERISRPVRERVMTPAQIDSYYHRRALKLRWSLGHGWKPASVEDVQFLSELTPEETAMSEDAFYESLMTDWPRSQSVAPTTTRGNLKATPRRTRRTCIQCGKQFLAHRSDAEYCSAACRNSASYRRGHRGNPRRSAEVPTFSAAIDTLSQKSTPEAAVSQ
jgi:hypothetical protein